VRFRPRLEALEDRTVPSANTYLVNLAGDAGTGSGTAGDIRYCINQADRLANAGSTITFDTKSLGSSTITLTKGQLVISDNMTVTGPGRRQRQHPVGQHRHGHGGRPLQHRSPDGQQQHPVRQ
jgi:hypothetical protein